MRYALVAAMVVTLAPLAGCTGGEEQPGPGQAQDHAVPDDLDTWLDHREGPLPEGAQGGTMVGDGGGAQGSGSEDGDPLDAGPGSGDGSDGGQNGADPGDQGDGGSQDPGDGGDDGDGGDGDDGGEDDPGLLDPVNDTVGDLDGSGTGTGEDGDDEEENDTLGTLVDTIEGDDEEESGSDDEEESGPDDEALLDALRG